MNTPAATSLADEYIKLMISHQPRLFGETTLTGEMQAQKIALALATLRAELIAKLLLQQ